MLINLTAFLSGFLISSIIDTSLGEFSEWAVVGSSLVVATVELFNSFYYSLNKRLNAAQIQSQYLVMLFDSLNYLKIGIVYGLIIDAFKLGS
jgi:hypothetical protein